MPCHMTLVAHAVASRTYAHGTRSCSAPWCQQASPTARRAAGELSPAHLQGRCQPLARWAPEPPGRPRPRLPSASGSVAPPTAFSGSGALGAAGGAGPWAERRASAPAGEAAAAAAAPTAAMELAGVVPEAAAADGAAGALDGGEFVCHIPQNLQTVQEHTLCSHADMAFYTMGLHQI